jgi:hypothetical protein
MRSWLTAGISCWRHLSQPLICCGLQPTHSFASTKAMTAHDNPAAGNVPVPVPDEVDTDFATLKKLITDIEAQQKIAEKKRKS